MEVSTIDKLRKVVYVAVEFTTAVADFSVVVRKPDGSPLSPAPIVTEQGDGVYTFEYTPDVAGVWQEKISSATNGDKVIRSVKVTLADVEDVKTQTESIETKVDTVQSDVTAVKTKTDNLPADTTAEFTSLHNDIADISAEIKPGGYFA